MKLLFDMNNVAIRCLHAKDIINESINDRLEIWKYIVFESIFNSMKKFKGNEIILAVDSRSWRREVYKPYKANREKNRDKDDFDWEMFFQYYGDYIEKLKNSLPFKVLKISRCEGDDIIATMAKHFTSNRKKSVIISADRDFKQLGNEYTIQFDPIKREEVSVSNINEYMMGEFLKGQGKDNVYNVITPEDWPQDKRKPGLGDKKVEKIINEGVENWLNKQEPFVKERFNQNKQILCLQNIPYDIEKSILDEYLSYELPNPDNILLFFKEMGWKSINENFTYYENRLLELY